MFESCLYTSRSTLKLSRCATETADIVRKAHVRNEALGITGALIFTGVYFAQVIEGPFQSVDRLLTRIMLDPRHCDLHVVDRIQVKERSFDTWKMAYLGPSRYIHRHLSPLLGEIVDGRDVAPSGRRLIALMKNLSHQENASRTGPVL